MTQNASAPRRIIVGVDSSDNAARAAGWAAREAADRSLPLHLVHALDLPGAMGMVIEPPEYAAKQTAAGALLLDRLTVDLRKQHPNLAVTGEVSELAPAETLVALSSDAELVVAGTRGHGGFSGLLLGSVSHTLAAHAHCPTIVVRGEQPGGPLDEIVLGVEPGQAQAPIRFAFDTAATVGASVTIVRAWWMRTAYEGHYTVAEFNAAQAKQEADIAELVKAVHEEYPHVEFSVNAIRGNPVPVLANAAHNARMLVVGAHRHRGPLSVALGYVAAGLLTHSPTPVAVVPIS
ncbi:MAG TPA: universal stress protein [Actinocrinis sp.]|nr:universal stress protein [Actinocrinis sp.]